jgi:hypothetical protein
MLYDSGSKVPQPTPADLDRLADEIQRVAGALNHARISGWLHDALRTSPSAR